MSLNQWKLLNQLRDSLNKLSNDTSFQNIFNRDALNIIKYPSVLANDVMKLFEPKPPAEKTLEKDEATSKNALKMPNILANLKKPQSPSKDPKQWMNNEIVVPTGSQTNNIIDVIETADNPSVLLESIESLIRNVIHHPEGRHNAIKAGMIRVLLKVRLQQKANQDIQGAIREALSLLGYADPVASNGIRILAMDGGGIRGILILEMLKKLEQLTGKRVNELFDLFCGVSTGAILAFSIGIHNKNLDEIAEGYKAISMEVFKQSPLWGTSNLVWSQSYYDTALWEKKLQDHLGINSLSSTARIPTCPKLCAVSAVVNQSRLSAYIFRNYSLPWRVKSQYFGGSQHQVWQAARASAAAPTYFEEFKLGKFLHQDGGILVNNPTAVGLHEAKLIWPNTPIQCVVSFGTGRTVPTPSDSVEKETASEKRAKSENSTSWANKFYRILDSATDTEGVHIMLNDLLPENVYYRFNPYLTEFISMVEIEPKKLEQLERDAIMYLRRNEDKFQEAAKALTQKKSHWNRVRESVNLKKDLYGLR